MAPDAGPGAGQTALFRVGEWTVDFDGRAFDGAAALPKSMKAADVGGCAQEIISLLRSAGVQPQTTCTMRSGSGFPASMMPRPAGQCRLLDGTAILAAGEKDVCGDPIRQTISAPVRGDDGDAPSGRRKGKPPESAQSYAVTFDAIGVAAVRLDASGKVVALAAGGLKSFACGDFRIELEDRVDLALWQDAKGQWQGVIQANVSDAASLTGPAAGAPPPIPDALRRITAHWARLRVPVPMVQK